VECTESLERTTTTTACVCGVWGVGNNALLRDSMMVASTKLTWKTRKYGILNALLLSHHLHSSCCFSSPMYYLASPPTVPSVAASSFAAFFFAFSARSSP
jgi:hypothetical protein